MTIKCLQSTEACEADNGAPKPASVPPNCPQVSPATLLPAGICTYANVSATSLWQLLILQICFFSEPKQSNYYIQLCMDVACEQFYTPEELRCMEASADGVHAKAREGRLPQTCFHETRGRGGGLKRTKFFFGARCELISPHALLAFPGLLVSKMKCRGCMLGIHLMGPRMSVTFSPAHICWKI